MDRRLDELEKRITALERQAQERQCEGVVTISFEGQDVENLLQVLRPTNHDNPQEKI